MGVSRSQFGPLLAEGSGRPARSEPLLTRPVVTGLVRAGDVGVVIAAGFLAGWLRYAGSAEDLPDFLPLVQLCGCLAAALLFSLLVPYELGRLRDPGRVIGRMMAAWSMAIGAVLVLLYAFKSGESVSRLWIGSWWLSGSLALLAFRVAVAVAIGAAQRAGSLRRNLLLIGEENARARFAERLRVEAPDEIELVAGLPFPETATVPEAEHPLARYPELAAWLRTRRIDEVVILAAGQPVEELRQLLHWLRAFPVAVSVALEGLDIGSDPLALVPLGSRAVLRMIEPALDGWSRVVKAIEDRLLGSLFLILASPLLLAIAIAVKLSSPGPVFYRQLRHGFNQEPIEVLKFRTMYVDRCDPPDARAVRQATRDDPRVTPLGRFLRRTSLDELPQLINVVRGEMSLVGPRPHALAHNDAFARVIDGYLARHRVKPGITGWAQVNGCRGETRTVEDMERRIRFDLEYVESWSLWWDLSILARTTTFVLGRRNAW